MGISLTYGDLPASVLEMARLCALDWIGVAIAGASDEVSGIVADEAIWNGGREESSIIGRTQRVPAQAAALVNGTLSHALDFDDVSVAMSGHPTAPLLGAALALAEARHASGRDLMTAFVAGYEAECRISSTVSPEHYQRGFHATATIGSFGAAMAAARILGLDTGRTAMALGIAGTLAAGLRAMFGTMCKPFHAGRASENGVVAARLAARGMTSRGDVIECRDGFAATHGPRFDPAAGLKEPAAGFHILSNLFKYHAACYRTHASIEAAARLREDHGLVPADISEVLIRTAPDADEICNIARPKTGLELKFSLTGTAALSLLRQDTAAVATYSDAMAADPGFVALVDRIHVKLVPGMASSESCVDIRLADGRSLSAASVVGVPEQDLGLLRRRLEAKFLQLVSPALSPSGARSLLELVNRIDALSDVGELTSRLRSAGKPSQP
jgi:2-methylcitrate dehydratase PrpD